MRMDEPLLSGACRRALLHIWLQQHCGFDIHTIYTFFSIVSNRGCLTRFARSPIKMCIFSSIEFGGSVKLLPRLNFKYIKRSEHNTYVNTLSDCIFVVVCVVLVN